jgi:hypothetical protein
MGKYEEPGSGRAYEAPKGYEVPVSLAEAKRYAAIIRREHVVGLLELTDEVNANVINAYADILVAGVRAKGKEVLYYLCADTGIPVCEMVVGDTGGIPAEKSQAALLAADGADVVSVHNHSSNESFSETDLFTTGKHDNIVMSTVIGHDGSVYEVVVDQLGGIDVAGLENEFAKLMNELREYINYSEFGEQAEQLLRNDVIDEICQRHGWQYSRRYYYER